MSADSTLSHSPPEDNSIDWLAKARDWETRAAQQPTEARRQFCLDRAEFCYRMLRLDAAVDQERRS